MQGVGSSASSDSEEGRKHLVSESSIKRKSRGQDRGDQETEEKRQFYFCLMRQTSKQPDPQDQS